jgi:hypothetical protein
MDSLFPDWKETACGMWYVLPTTLNQATTMKTLKCDLCDTTADGETFEEWMTALRPHYMEAHADVMNDSSKTKEDMERWMAENKARFDGA